MEKIAQRNETRHPGEDQPGSAESKHGLNCCSESNYTPKESDKETQQVDVGWTSGTVNVPIDVQCKTLETKAHSEKSMNVSDVQVSDEDGYLSRTMTIRANLNEDPQFANKIAKE